MTRRDLVRRLVGGMTAAIVGPRVIAATAPQSLQLHPDAFRLAMGDGIVGRTVSVQLPMRFTHDVLITGRAFTGTGDPLKLPIGARFTLADSQPIDAIQATP